MRIDEAAAPPCSGVEQIGLVQLRSFTLARYDQVGDVTDDIADLGIYSCREIRDGGRMSVHADGRAWDSRWEDRGEQLGWFEFLIGNADPLGVQRIIDYSQQRIWEAGRGWFGASPSSPGNAGGTPCHVERNWAGALDARPIEEIVGKPAGPRPPLGRRRRLMLYVRVKGGKSDNPLYISDGLSLRHLGAGEVDVWRSIAANSPDKPHILQAKDARHLQIVGATNENTVDPDKSLNE